MKSSSTNKLGALAASMVVALAAASPAMAQTTTGTTSTTTKTGWGGMHQRMPGVFGTVSAINGSTITIQSHAGPNSQSGTTYTVDASSATVDKNGSSSSLASIAVGDTVMVQGTVSGSSVTATMIRDGMPSRGAWGTMGTSTRPMKPMGPAIQGNGEPIVAGSVSAVNGSTLTVTTKAGPAYTVDASNATVTKGNATSSAASIAVGDHVVVQGQVNGSSVTASTVLDQGVAPSSASASSTAQMHAGFWGGIGGFFGGLLKMFGF